MSSAPARFLVEAILLVSLGVALALAGADPLVSGAVLVAGVLLLGAVEGALLQEVRWPLRRTRATASEVALPRDARPEEPSAELVADASVAAAGAVQTTVEPPVATPPEAPAQPDREPADAALAAVVAEPQEVVAEEEPAAAIHLPAGSAPPATGPDAADEPTADDRRTALAGEPAATVAPPPPVGHAAEVQRPAAAEPTPSETEQPARTEAAAPPVRVELPARGPSEWNLWDLERRARERYGEDPYQDEEWAALFVYLREYASPDGMLPPAFDELVREAFEVLVGTRSH